MQQPNSHVDFQSNKEEEQTQEIEAATSGSDHSKRNDADHPHSDGRHKPVVHEKMNPTLFMGLLAMSFLWVGSQIPLYLFGSVLPKVYSDIGGADRYVWFITGYLIPNAALCPFVGALSDMFGRRYVGMLGQLLLIIGPVVTATAHSMNIAIAGQVLSGLGAGLNELIALVGTAEMVPIRKRGTYVGMVVFTILPFCPSALWAQLITRASNWRYNGIVVGVWNAIGLALVTFCYKDPPRANKESRKAILRQIDYIGGILSTLGILCFMMGMQFGAEQYASWKSIRVLVPFCLGIFLIIVFFAYEVCLAKHRMVPREMFHKAKRTMILILFITFLSGANYFAMLLFWPTQVFNVYGDHPVKIGLLTLPIGFGIIGGAFIALLLIPITKGRITAIMIFFTALMTAGTGAVAISTPHNLGPTLAVVTLASIGVGGVIIPSSIIAQIVCPAELIGTITAITLSIRYIGGAIGFTAYQNAYVHEFTQTATQRVAIDTLIGQSIVTASERDFYALQAFFTRCITLIGYAEYPALRELIFTSPLVTRADKGACYDLIIDAAQEAFAKAYRWPYFISIPFGGICLILALFLGNIRRFLTEDIAAAEKGRGEDGEGEREAANGVAGQTVKAGEGDHHV